MKKFFLSVFFALFINVCAYANYDGLSSKPVENDNESVCALMGYTVIGQIENYIHIYNHGEIANSRDASWLKPYNVIVQDGKDGYYLEVGSFFHKIHLNYDREYKGYDVSGYRYYCAPNGSGKVIFFNTSLIR